MSDTPPAPHEFEISVFGPGIGECIVVHLGDGDWIIVDSCLDRASGRPAALHYLESLGVDVGTRVRLVVATHWHDDHIQGLAEIARVAVHARFVNSAAYAFTDLTRVVKAGAQTATSTATKEFSEILDILVSRVAPRERVQGIGPLLATANRKLLALAGHERSLQAEVFSLSPADSAVNMAKTELEVALSMIRRRLRPIKQGPNQLCVVLWLKVGKIEALLGADLEHINHTNEGWQAICNSAERPVGRAAYFKVAHHGSENADSADCWANLLKDRPTAFVTPYAPSRIPRQSDLRRLCSRGGEVYLTSDPSSYGSPRRDNAVEKTLREVALARRSLRGQTGHARLRCDARTGDALHVIELRNGARRQCDDGRLGR